MTKIYSDDPNLPYKTTKLTAIYTKSEIDGIFAKWGVKDIYWHWDLEHNDVFVKFKINETINERPYEVSAKVEAPIIWERKTKKSVELVNWNISMRVMYWFIKSHLESAYLLQSSKVVAFLPYISANNEQSLKDILVPRLNELRQLEKFSDKIDVSKVIEVE